MKKIFALIVIVAMFTTNVNAQNKNYYNTRHEIGVTVGSGATSEIISGLADATSMLVSAAVSSVMTGGAATGYYNYGDAKYIPTITAEYYYHVNKYIGLGGFVGFNGLTRDMYVNWNDNVNGTHHKEKSGEATRRNLSIIPGAKIDWLRMKNFGLYSKAGVGVTFMYEHQKDDEANGLDYSDTTVIPNINLSLLGMEAGSENIRGFIEMGFGEQGILLAGVKYKF